MMLPNSPGIKPHFTPSYNSSNRKKNSSQPTELSIPDENLMHQVSCHQSSRWAFSSVMELWAFRFHFRHMPASSSASANLWVLINTEKLSRAHPAQSASNESHLIGETWADSGVSLASRDASGTFSSLPLPRSGVWGELYWRQLRTGKNVLWPNRISRRIQWLSRSSETIRVTHRCDGTDSQFIIPTRSPRCWFACSRERPARRTRTVGRIYRDDYETLVSVPRRSSPSRATYVKPTAEHFFLCCMSSNRKTSEGEQ